MKMTSEDEQRWLDVLSGKAHPCNADERIAAGLRECFRREDRQADQPAFATFVPLADPHPETLALQIQRCLLRHGVTVRMAKRGQDWFVAASVAAPMRTAVARALRSAGVVLSQDGRLSLRVSARG